MINIEDLECFKVLNFCKNRSNISKKEKINIANACHLPKKEVKTFFNSISGFKNNKGILEKLIDLTTKSSGIE